MAAEKWQSEGYPSWGAWVRSKRLSLTPVQGHVVAKAWDAELNAYDSAVAQGVQPKSTRLRDSQAAVRVAQATQVGNPW